MLLNRIEISLSIYCFIIDIILIITVLNVAQICEMFHCLESDGQSSDNKKIVQTTINPEAKFNLKIE